MGGLRRRSGFWRTRGRSKTQVTAAGGDKSPRRLKPALQMACTGFHLFVGRLGAALKAACSQDWLPHRLQGGR
jgi:hypothetical protein